MTIEFGDNTPQHQAEGCSCGPGFSWVNDFLIPTVIRSGSPEDVHGCDLSTTYLGLLEQRQVNPTGKDGYIILNVGGIMFPRISTTFISGVVDKGEYTVVKDELVCLSSERQSVCRKLSKFLLDYITYFVPHFKLVTFC